jgi:hypothetical protein
MNRILFAMAMVIASTGAMPAQDQRSDVAKFYKIDFAIKELEGGKVVNTRTFSMVSSPSQPFNAGQIRTGDKVAVVSGTFAGGNTQYTYVDLGVSIDCRVVAVVDNQIMMTITADVSSLASQGSPPVVAQTKWNSGATVPLRKPTVLFTAEGASNKRQMQLEATVTPI